MSDDYWNSQDAAINMGFMGKQVGLREGHRQGFEDGRHQGFQEGAAAMQKRMEVQIAQLRAEINDLREFSNGAVITLDAAAEALAASGNQEAMGDFIVAYAKGVEQGIDQKHFPVPPHADGRFVTRMPWVAQLVKDTLTSLSRR